MNQGKILEPLSRRAGIRAWRFHASVIAVLAFIGAISMFVQFDQDIGTWKKGEIHDLPDGVGRAFIAGQQARESDAVAHLRASQASEFAIFKAELMETVRGAIKPAAPSNRQPPNGGGGMDFTKIHQGEYTVTPPEELDKSRTFTDALRCVALTNCRDVDPALGNYCRNRMRLYSDEFTEYNLNESNGKFESTTTRQLADGGLETIKRTGTDSLSGGATYGFTLKPEYVGSLWRIAREASVFEDGCRRIPVSQGNEVIWPHLQQFKAPTVLNGIPQAAVFGGITLAYKGETTARVSSDAAVAENRFHVDDLTGMTDFSRDYIVDNYIAMDSEVTRIFGEAIGWIRDWVYINGDGIGKPQGFRNANATLTTGPTSGARDINSTITAKDCAYMLSRLSSQCWPRARWLSNITNFPSLYILAKRDGTPVFQPNALIDQAMLLSIMKGSSVDEAALVSRPMGLLLGKPLYLTEKLPPNSTTSVGDFCLVDPYQYGDATRSGIEVGVSEHFYFSTDRIAYRFKMRHFGKSLWPAPYTQADNVATPASGTQVSPFIVLNSTSVSS